MVNRLDFYQDPRCFHWDPRSLIWRTFNTPDQPDSFFQTSDSVTFLTSWLPNFMQKKQKKWWAISVILHCGRVDKRIFWAKSIGHFILNGCVTKRWKTIYTKKHKSLKKYLIHWKSELTVCGLIRSFSAWHPYCRRQLTFHPSP